MSKDSLLEAAPGLGAQPVYVQTAVAEPPYSVWNVLFLGTVAGMLPSFPNGPTILAMIKAPLSAFSARWSAE